MKLYPLGIQVSDNKMTAWSIRITANKTLEKIVGLLANSIRLGRSPWHAFSTIKPEVVVYHITEHKEEGNQRSKWTSFEMLKHDLRIGEQTMVVNEDQEKIGSKLVQE